MIDQPGEIADVLPELEPTAIDRLVQVARWHGVEAWLAAVAPTGAPGWDELAEQRLRFAAARARSRSELTRFGRVADSLGCAWVAVKGDALAEDVYPRPDLRRGVDTDVLVEPARFGDVLEGLQSEGWRLLDLNWPLLDRVMLGEVRLQSPTGALYDVHWHLLNSDGARRQFHLPTKELLVRRRVLDSGLTVLADVDQLLHLALHGALAGGHRLLWLVDLYLASLRIVDWPATADACGRARIGPALGLLARRANTLLRTAIPPSALDSAGGGTLWRLVCRLVDARSPLQEDPTRPSAARALARSVQATPRRSLLEFASHGMAFARSKTLREHPESPFGAGDQEHDPLLPIADEVAKSRYFAAIAACED
jgi:hypothetical protein